MAEWNDPVDTMTVAVHADTTQFQQQIADASRLGRQFGNSLVTAFDGIAIKGKGVGDVLRSLALNLSQLVLKSALKPLTNGLGGALAGLFGGGGLGFAKGGVIQQRLPVPFASGGVISSPMTFPLAGGRMGLAGERMRRPTAARRTSSSSGWRWRCSATACRSSPSRSIARSKRSARRSAPSS